MHQPRIAPGVLCSPKINVLIFTLKFVTILLIPTAQGQSRSQEDLPFHPDSVYKYIAKSTEKMVKPAEIPDSVSAEGWKEDLDHFRKAVYRTVPYPNALIDSQVFQHRIDSVKSTIATTSRNQRIMALYRLMNFPSKGTGHFRVFGSQRAFGWHAMPFYLYRFEDGVYIMAAHDTALIGREIHAINDVPIQSVYSKLAPFVSADNRWSRPTHVEERLLKWAEPLQALGIIDKLDDFTITVAGKNGEATKVQSHALEVRSADYVRLITSPSHRPKTPEALQWSPASVQENNEEPFYRVRYVDSLDLLYLQFNTLVSETRVPRFSNQSTEELADSLAALADSLPLKKFVIDLRTNSGGITSDGDPIVEMVSKHPQINKKGTFYTLIGTYTNSAAGLFSMKLEQRSKTIFAGQNSGFSPNIWGEIVPVILPNTRIVVYLSYAYYEGGFPATGRYFIEPKLKVPYTSRQHFQNQDKTMQAVLEHKADPVAPQNADPAKMDQLAGYYRLSLIHRVRIYRNNGWQLRIERGESESFVQTGLYPVSDSVYQTDLDPMQLKVNPDNGNLSLSIAGKRYPLTPTDSSFTLPLEYIRAGQLKQGSQAFFRALDAGILLGNDFVEYPLTTLYEGEGLESWPKDLSAKEQAKHALPYNELAVDMAGCSWRVHANLALIYRAMGNHRRVEKLARTILELAPNKRGFIRSELGLELDL